MSPWMRLLTLALALPATPAWADDRAMGGELPVESSAEAPGAQVADWELQDWELDIQRCLFTPVPLFGFAHPHL